MADIVYRGNIFYRGRIVKGTVTVENGIIKGVHGEAYSERAETVLDYSVENGFLLIPGVVDMHVHLRGLELSYKEDESSGSAAAAAGGVVLVADMPNTRPQIRSFNVLKEKIKSLKEKCIVDYLVYVGVPSRIEEADSLLSEKKVAGLKVYPEDYHSPILGECVSKSLEKRKLVVVHPEHPECLRETTVPGMRWRYRPLRAELESVAYFQEKFGNMISGIHFTHITSFETAVRARALGATVDTCPHYVLLNNSYEKEYGCYGKVNPPLRPKTIVQGLLIALRTGLIDCISSDHAPHSLEEKQRSFMNCPSGIPGLETMLPLTWTLVEKNVISVSDIVKLMCRNPSRILGLHRMGEIERGYVASMTLLKLGEEYKIKPENFYSKAKYTPFENFAVKCRIHATIVKGKIVFYDGEVIANK